MTLENGVLIAAGILTGLLAGVYYAFSVAVVPGLRGAPAVHHITVMQAINDRIKNPVFFLSFFGPTLLLPLAAFLYQYDAQFVPLVAAAALHIVGGNGITIVGNIPLNERFAKINALVLSDAAAEAIRAEFQGAGAAWMRWHTARTLAEIGAAGLVLVAAVM